MKLRVSIAIKKAIIPAIALSQKIALVLATSIPVTDSGEEIVRDLVSITWFDSKKIRNSEKLCLKAAARLMPWVLPTSKS